MTTTSLTLGPVLGMIMLNMDENDGLRALQLTVLITFAAGVVGMYSGLDFSGLGIYLGFALLGLMLLRLVMLFTIFASGQRRLIAIGGAIALLFRSLLFEPFNIPSGSMIPTLRVGDYLFVSKFSYGYSRYSFPLGLIPFEGRIMADEPERGDVIVFRQPSNESISFIKRLVGLPGDMISVKQGILNINDQPVTRLAVAEGTPVAIATGPPLTL